MGGMMSASMRIVSIHHVSLSVSDLERSQRFYEGLGFREVVHWRSPDASLQIKHLLLAGFVLELFCYASPLSGQKLSLEADLQTLGIRHFALRVPSLQEAREQLLQAGYLLATEPKKGRTGIDYFFLRDPDGVFVEIVEDNRVF